MTKAEIAKNRADAAEAFLKGDANFQSSALSSQVIVAGSTGKVTALELREVGQGQDQFKRTPAQGPQRIGGIVVAEVGQPSVTMSLVFDNGKSISLSTLTQHEESTIGDENAMNLPGKEWQKYVGKILTCTKSDADNSKMISRLITGTDGKPTRDERATRIYAFDVA